MKIVKNNGEVIQLSLGLERVLMGAINEKIADLTRRQKCIEENKHSTQFIFPFEEEILKLKKPLLQELDWARFMKVEEKIFVDDQGVTGVRVPDGVGGMKDGSYKKIPNPWNNGKAKEYYEGFDSIPRDQKFEILESTS